MKTKRSHIKKVSLDEYEQLLYGIRSYIKSTNKVWREAVGSFLINGALAFDRFVEPRPKYVDDKMYKTFSEFIATLQIHDGDFYGRTYFFHLERIKWRLFKDCSLLPYNERTMDLLAECERDIKKLSIPLNAEQRIIDNLRVATDDVFKLMDCIRTKKILTRIHTSLPYILTDTDCTITLKVKGINIKTTIKNNSHGERSWNRWTDR